jgi:hypothetical protein
MSDLEKGQVTMAIQLKDPIDPAATAVPRMVFE